MDYYKKYLKYKAKYFQLKLLNNYEVKISDENPSGIVDFDLSNRLNIYQISGIISCIGIVIRSYTEDGYTVNVNAGKAVHFIHTDHSDESHFIDKPDTERRESQLTQMGKDVIKNFEGFIVENSDYEIQLDFITSGKTDGIHKSTQFMVELLIERFTEYANSNMPIENFKIKHHKGISSITIDPQTFGF